MLKITPSLLKKLERFLQIFAVITVGIHLLLWLFLKTPYLFVILGIVLTDLLLILFVVFMRVQYKRRHDSFLKEGFSYWKSILIMEVISVIFWFLF